jgi:hypothetical protein
MGKLVVLVVLGNQAVLSMGSLYKSREYSLLQR